MEATANELLRCIKKVLPDAHCTIWETANGPEIRWDSSYNGPRITVEEALVHLDAVRADAAAEAQLAEAMQNLAGIDLKSIRSLREWIAKQPDAPEFAKDYEAQAIVERAKLQKQEKRTVFQGDMDLPRPGAPTPDGMTRYHPLCEKDSVI